MRSTIDEHTLSAGQSQVIYRGADTDSDVRVLYGECHVCGIPPHDLAYLPICGPSMGTWICHSCYFADTSSDGPPSPRVTTVQSSARRTGRDGGLSEWRDRCIADGVAVMRNSPAFAIAKEKAGRTGASAPVSRLSAAKSLIASISGQAVLEENDASWERWAPLYRPERTPTDANQADADRRGFIGNITV